MCPKNCYTFHDNFKDGRGDRSQGGFADRVRFSGAYAFKVPANISPDEGNKTNSFSPWVLLFVRSEMQTLRTKQYVSV